MKTFTQHINEENNIDTLVICDIQQEFEKFFPKNYIEEVFKYCVQFPTVYQIFDTHKSETPSFTFPNQQGIFAKKYGTNFSKDLKKITDKFGQTLTKQGDILKFKNVDSAIVKIGNHHSWFYVPEKIVELYNILKGKKVILVGGGDGECLKDIYVSMKAFGIFPIYNHKYIYSSKTNNQQQHIQ